MNTTDNIRRAMVQSGQAHEDLAADTGERWTTDELKRDFEVLGFSAPFVVVRRRSDGLKGSLGVHALTARVLRLAGGDMITERLGFDIGDLVEDLEGDKAVVRELYPDDVGLEWDCRLGQIARVPKRILTNLSNRVRDLDEGDA